MTRPNPTTYRLTFQDAIMVWLLEWEGVHQHHIAARFGVNPGRVNEVLKGHKHQGSREAALSARAA
jgi:predicted XRE-type DNA-binding protein